MWSFCEILVAPQTALLHSLHKNKSETQKAWGIEDLQKKIQAQEGPKSTDDLKNEIRELFDAIDVDKSVRHAALQHQSRQVYPPNCEFLLAGMSERARIISTCRAVGPKHVQRGAA